MKVLIISPLGYAVHSGLRYAGIERLAAEFAHELAKNHEVTIMGRSDSHYDPSVEVIGYLPEHGEDIFKEAELCTYLRHQSRFREYDVIHDFSHQHLAARFNKLPTVNNIWHAPAVARFPKAPYNIICPSRWAVIEYRKHYGQTAKYMPTIVLDTTVYKLAGKKRNNRMLSLGMITPRKGHLEAARLCIEAEVPLDIAGRKGGEAPDYEKAIDEICQNPLIDYLGEVSDEEKIDLFQTNAGLIFYNQEEEVTSHKIQEAMLCGMPVVCPPIGAIPEIVVDKRDGLLVRTDEEYIAALNNLPQPDRESHQRVVKAYGVKEVVAQWIPLYEQVADGLRW